VGSQTTFSAKSRDLQIAISCFVSGLSCFGLLYYYQALLPALVTDFKITTAESSLALSASTLGLALGLMSIMFIADRYSRKRVIGYSLILASILSFASSFVAQFWLLIFINFLKGFLLSGATSVCLAYISEEVSASKKLKITGFYMSGNAIGGMLGRVLSAQIAHEYSWQTASLWMGGMGIILAILFFVSAPQSQHFITKKEIEEQKPVTDYISSVLKKYSSQVQQSETYDHISGKIKHLRTDFQIKTNLETVDTLLKDLHPTPAVCGIPKEDCKKWILELENFDREWYAGYSKIETSDIICAFVNLRCGQFYQNQAEIWVGGGITKDSNPEKEWRETELKASSITECLVYR
jgi:hypothetical protein